MKDGRIPGQMKRRIGAWLEGVRQNEQQLALVLSLVIGVLVGLVIVAFILLTGRLTARMYPAGVAPWRRLFVPTIGSLLAGYLLFRYFPLARGSGIPQTKFALFVVDGLITLRTVVGKLVCCSISLASGIALGREGPSVHIGAGLASVMARRLGLSDERVKELMPVGGIGDAELARGNFRAAQASFQRASRLNPDDRSVRERLVLCEDVLALDPTGRGLTSAERYRRSIKLVELPRPISIAPSRCGKHG
jgi:hypothetical protein